LKPESIFESGNEKSYIPLSLGASFLKTGYNIKPDHKFTVINEFQNQKEEEQYVWLTLTYEYFDGPQPDYKQTKVLWLSVGPSICDPKRPNPFGASNLTVAGQPKLTVFEESSIPWTAPFNGTIVGMGGHLHDGGIHLRIYHNQEEECDATPDYGKPGKAGLMGGKADDGQSHIEMMEACVSFKDFSVGDTFHLKAEYDFNVHKGMENNKGEMDGVMGIAAVILAV
jgi:hypothetical protein